MSVIGGDKTELDKLSSNDRIQLRLGEGLNSDLNRYVRCIFGEDERIKSSIIKRALREFLDKEGYLTKGGE